MDKVTLEVSKKEIVNALLHLPPTERESILHLLKRVESGNDEIIRLSSLNLDELTGIMKVGGDAVTDSEEIYD
jgi:hypothetical protein